MNPDLVSINGFTVLEMEIENGNKRSRKSDSK